MYYIVFKILKEIIFNEVLLKIKDIALKKKSYNIKTN